MQSYTHEEEEKFLDRPRFVAMEVIPFCGALIRQGANPNKLAYNPTLATITLRSLRKYLRLHNYSKDCINIT